VIFNIGDFLMRWSNDDLKSTLHRVRAPPRAQNNNIDTDPDEMVPERFSIPYVRVLPHLLIRSRHAEWTDHPEAIGL
jgi:isopenicillin N synthase-like dioxygenase